MKTGIFTYQCQFCSKDVDRDSNDFTQFDADWYCKN